MILLDSDHLTILHYREHPGCGALENRLLATGEQIGITVISIEEQMRGWLAEITKRHDVFQQISAYDRLITMMHFFRQFTSRLDEAAANEFARLKKLKIRVGTQDLKIAAITLANHALLLSANLRDFQKVPGLRVENWLS